MRGTMRLAPSVAGCLLGLAVAAIVAPAPVHAQSERLASCRPVELFADDFSRFPPGWLSKPVGTLNGAIQEYHYLPHRGVPTKPWANALCHLDAWVVGDEEGVPYLEQHMVSDNPDYIVPQFVTGDPAWVDTVIEVKMKPLSAQHFAGVAFRYQTNKHHYVFSLAGGKEARLLLRAPIDTAYRTAVYRPIASKPFSYDSKKYYQIRIENEGPSIRVLIDGKPVIEARDGELKAGKVALLGSSPARFAAFKVSACPKTKQAIAATIAKREQELTRLRAENPQPKVWKKFSTPKFGAGRNVRFGDLDGDGKTDMLIAQNVPRVMGDAFDHISALTAVSLDGRVLWQSGRPDPRNGLLTNDTPFQIHDVDADGKTDVLLIRDFKLQLLDGKTGKVKRWVWMPAIPANATRRPYELYSGDSIVFANLTGKPGRRDFLLKDRYRHFWAFSRDLKPLWEADDDTGHFPYPFDVDNDGRDEVFVGHAMYDHQGRKKWSHGGSLKDHVDAVAVGNFTGDPKAEPRVYWSTSDEGFIMLDLRGNILKHTIVGHTQTAAVGKFRPDLPGLQYATTNFWRNPGIVSVFDADGNLLTQGEPIHTGSVTLPVNWRGDGQEFVLLSGNVHEGGMIDGHLRRVVMFPDDGHPDLTSQVLDVTGDARDEVVLWDESAVWVYTQDGPSPKGKLYAPLRNPRFNDSNYRANVSLPGWRDPTAATPTPHRPTAATPTPHRPTAATP